MSGTSLQGLTLLGALCLSLTSLTAAQAHGAGTLFVANNGVDSATCGASQSPCRSLSRAIDNARDGDRILVRPGVYGELTGDGDFNDPGEEAAEIGGGCRCMILVDKRLVIASTDGPTVTVLDARGAQLDVVNITASHVVFGGDGAGFTVTGARTTGDDDGFGVAILADEGVRVIGNIAVDNRSIGFAAQGSRNIIRNNLSISNGSGFNLGATGAEGHFVIGNVAVSNGNEQEGGNGISLFGERQRVMGNRSIGNDGLGFFLVGAGGPEFLFQENEAIGNRGVGIWAEQSLPMELHRNNIYGNLGLPLFGFFPALPNCGLANRSGSDIDATRNYWGAPSGPGPDPADDAGPGSICDLNGETLVTPFAPRPFSVWTGPRLLDTSEAR
ncbi:hypothetical protein HPC49_17180 [Pyxidicoccus fallax]|uniref:Periplasmic copper-binding protein NosD beta helix domain-containing protein n=1 Tax=Pyxidicoccus fallax TaxID=394095 RepID=A0A848LCL4_9BACT|nr:NosD domain-containing protein [Pyxidicoccus fallax]NMO15972.1 hypothetical protein [Pyxidicoccus fallax]NPC79948.1 hypothetical protein [Pyxidicoccus fallax]